MDSLYWFLKSLTPTKKRCKRLSPKERERFARRRAKFLRKRRRELLD